MQAFACSVGLRARYECCVNSPLESRSVRTAIRRAVFEIAGILRHWDQVKDMRPRLDHGWLARSRGATPKAAKQQGAVCFNLLVRASTSTVLGAIVVFLTAFAIPAGVAAAQKVLARHSGAAIQLRSAPLTVSIPLKGDSWAIQAAGDRGQLALELQNVEFNGPPGVYYDIYIDLPPDVQNPPPNSKHFVGKLTPMPERKLDPASGNGNHVPYSIADVVRGLNRTKTFNPDVMTITFVPRGLGTGQQGRHARVSTIRARIGGLRVMSTT